MIKGITVTLYEKKKQEQIRLDILFTKKCRLM